MDRSASWITDIMATAGGLFRQGLDYLPGIIGALLILLIGWLLARLVRAAAKALINQCNEMLQRTFSGGLLATLRFSKPMVTVIGDVFFWCVIVASIAVAANTAGLNVMSRWLTAVTTHIPNLIAALGIFIVGYLLSIFVREELLPAEIRSGDSPQNLLFARLVQGAVMGVALIVGLDQLGVEVGLLIALSITGAAALFLSVGLSFALGAKTHMSNLIGARAARAEIAAGQKLRIGDIEGRVVEVSASQLIVETPAGKTLIPGHLLAEQALTILIPEGTEKALEGKRGSPDKANE